MLIFVFLAKCPTILTRNLMSIASLAISSSLAKQYKKSGAVDDLVGLFTFITFTLQHEGNLPLVVLRNFIYVYADIYKTYRDSVVLFLRTNIMVCNRIASKLVRVLAGGIHNLHQMSLKDKLETLFACDLMAQSVIGFAGIGEDSRVPCSGMDSGRRKRLLSRQLPSVPFSLGWKQ